MNDTAIWILIIVMGVVAIALFAIDLLVIAPSYEKKEDEKRCKWIKENLYDGEQRKKT